MSAGQPQLRRMIGLEGVPFLGYNPMAVSRHTAEHKQPRTGEHVFVELLDLTNPEHLLRYQEISQRTAEEYVQLSYEEREFDSTSGKWFVLIRWIEFYLFNPEEFPNGIPNPKLSYHRTKEMEKDAALNTKYEQGSSEQVT